MSQGGSRIHSSRGDTYGRTRDSSRFERYVLVLTSTHKYTQILTNTHKYSPILTNTYKYSPILTDSQEYLQILSNTFCLAGSDSKQRKGLTTILYGTDSGALSSVTVQSDGSTNHLWTLDETTKRSPVTCTLQTVHYFEEKLKNWKRFCVLYLGVQYMRAFLRVHPRAILCDRCIICSITCRDCRRLDFVIFYISFFFRFY